MYVRGRDIMCVRFRVGADVTNEHTYNLQATSCTRVRGFYEIKSPKLHLFVVIKRARSSCKGLTRPQTVGRMCYSSKVWASRGKRILKIKRTKPTEAVAVVKTIILLCK